MTLQLLELDPGKYTPHPLHAPDRDWTETNCWLDMMIEVIHTLGLEPLAASSFTLSTDFDGDQWRLFKFPPEDLRVLFGLEIEEMYVWRPVIDHLEDNLRLGRLLTVEVDAYFLPDTGGVSHRIEHLKTAIVPQMLDRPGRRLGYFHNAGYFELDGEDFDGIFSLDGAPDPRRLLPYVEIVRTDRLRAGEPPLDLVLSLTRDHLARRPATNPIARFKKRLQSDLPWLEEAGEAVFHPYSFGTSRQLGATAALAAAFVDWLDARLHAGLDEASRQFRHLSESAKALQFALARVVRGRHVEVDAPFESMEQAWESAMGTLAERLAPTGAAAGPGSPN